VFIFCCTLPACEIYIRIGSSTNDRALSNQNTASLQQERELNLQLQREIDDLNGRIAHLERDIALLRKKRFSILFTGDILIANGVVEEMQSQGLNYPFKKIADELKTYDIVFGNLETPIASGGKPYTDKAYTFALDPKLAVSLRWIKLDMVSLSNNHIMDYGEEGMRETISALEDMNILYTGAGKTSMKRGSRFFSRWRRRRW
jgi:poly-gamma-glutamate synthesis protein (capsule biosynthesis protein)